MPERPRPYFSRPNPRRWSNWILLVVAVATIAMWGRRPTGVWARVFVFAIGALFFVSAIDALRSGRAEFRWGISINFDADREDHPVRFWLFTAMNFALGAAGMVNAVLADPL